MPAIELDRQRFETAMMASQETSQLFDRGRGA
ncbi:hypothetical protein X754_05900 [Mesorhizobium sp. LNJC403B00]|nr:hypothetical protein X754_05900 [Mesorhizobium sp. LNJC403B00]